MDETQRQELTLLAADALAAHLGAEARHTGRGRVVTGIPDVTVRCEVIAPPPDQADSRYVPVKFAAWLGPIHAATIEEVVLGNGIGPNGSVVNAVHEWTACFWPPIAELFRSRAEADEHIRRFRITVPSADGTGQPTYWQFYLSDIRYLAKGYEPESVQDKLDRLRGSIQPRELEMLERMAPIFNVAAGQGERLHWFHFFLYPRADGNTAGYFKVDSVNIPPLLQAFQGFSWPEGCEGVALQQFMLMYPVRRPTPEMIAMFEGRGS